jgi:hypothetical protein
VTSLRSAAGGPVSIAAAGAVRAGAASSGVPHSPQKRVPGSFAAPQAGQARASGVPHSPQNFRHAPFSAPQSGQTTIG